VKRTVVAAAAAVVAVALSSCGVEESSTAAEVADRTVSVDEFESVMQALASSGGEAADPATGTIAGQTARQYLSVMVQGEVNDVFLADHGEQITDADRKEATATLTIPSGIPADVTRLIEDNAAAPAVRTRIAAPSPAELQRMYDARPSDLGVVCTRQIVLPTEAEAQAVVDALDAGGSFADQVSRSTDAASKAAGGALQSESGEACIPGYTTAVDRAIVTALADAAPGEVVGPVRTADGWLVLQQRPYAEIADSLSTLYASAAGDLLYYGYLLHTPVRISPRYGTWDRSGAAVVPLSGA
jgi:parvulin-like peptidyl-prolyl isomerase